MICRSFMIHNDVKNFRRLLKRFALTFIAEKYRWYSYQAMKRDASAAEDDDAGSSDGMSAKRVKKTDGPMGSKGKGKAPANVSFLHKRFSHQIFYSRICHGKPRTSHIAIMFSTPANILQQVDSDDSDDSDEEDWIATQTVRKSQYKESLPTSSHSLSSSHSHISPLFLYSNGIQRQMATLDGLKRYIWSNSCATTSSRCVPC